METLIDFLPALIFFWVILRAIRGAGKRRRTQGAAPAAPGRPAAGFGGFEELVRRLEEAAREAQENAAAQVPSVQVVTPRPAPPPLAYDDEYRPVESSTVSDFTFVGAVDEPAQPTEFHETHSLNALVRPSAAMPSLDMPSAHLHDPLMASPRPVHPLVTRLRTVASAREAILLKDVLGPPKSRRR